jgi:hypothetical protein
MIGAAVVLFLGGLVFPITLLVAALLIDVVVAMWVLFRMSHDHWWPELLAGVSRASRRVRSVARHRQVARPAH